MKLEFGREGRGVESFRCLFQVKNSHLRIQRKKTYVCHEKNMHMYVIYVPPEQDTQLVVLHLSSLRLYLPASNDIMQQNTTPF